MSFLAALAPRLASLAAQPAVVAAGLATGVAVGAVGVGTGAIPVADRGPRLIALVECPDAGAVVANLESDQDVLVTARSADGQWLEIYLGEAGASYGWARASALSLRAAPGSLPVADCTPAAGPQLTIPPETIVPPSAAASLPASASPGAPSETPASTTPAPTPSTAPSTTPKPTGTPKPTPTPLTGPVLSNLQVYNGEDAGGGKFVMHYDCGPGVWNTFGFTVDAADPDGIASVTVHWDPAGAPADSLPMSDEDGFGTNWDGGFDAQASYANGPIKVWFQGVDKLGNLGPVFDSTDEGISFALAPCPPVPT